MTTVNLNCAAGMSPSHAPAKAAPTAGASLEVSAAEVRGFRRLNGFALSVSRLARSLVKKRCNRRWESSIKESEADNRTFSDL